MFRLVRRMLSPALNIPRRKQNSAAQVYQQAKEAMKQCKSPRQREDLSWLRSTRVWQYAKPQNYSCRNYHSS